MIQFSKYQGLGNDFLILSISDQLYSKTFEALTPQKIIQLCDRRYGIGADGIILSLASNSTCDIRMKIYNSDGTEAEMCGNGIRCLVRYLFDNQLVGLHKELTVETLAGPIRTRINDDFTITVDMGRPVLIPSKIPTDLQINDEGIPSAVVKLDNEKHIIYSVGMGNPHLILYIKDINLVDVERWGRKLEFHSDFPLKTNVHFVQIKSRSKLDIKVWERGCGATLACGTGACACVVASKLLGYSDSNVLVHLPGGELKIKWQDKDSNIFMTGPAQYIFSGNFTSPQISVN